VARGTVAGVISASKLHTFIVRPGTAALARKLRDLPGVEQVAPFGNNLHVVGSDRELLRRSVEAAMEGSGAKAVEDATALEDVFIQLMAASTDNFGNGARK